MLRVIVEKSLIK